MDASQGYISFLIYPRPDLSLGTVVTNRAAIYFDFNEPIITNTVSRKYDQLYSLSTDAPASGAWLPVRIYPNPFADFTTLELPDTAPSGTYSFELFDMGGRTLKNLSFNSSSLLIQREDIPAGIMGWRLVREGQIVASGKLSVVGNE
ncbi:MAG TPA: T9SS type A sorting domain-containing protein [Saprospiraceae bacterium]|nr:T9SS type A sorting domain-containing protein [Saprospiraceae bacterium]